MTGLGVPGAETPGQEPPNCSGCGFKTCPTLGQPCCDLCNHAPPPASAGRRRVIYRRFWQRWGRVYAQMAFLWPGLVLIAAAPFPQAFIGWGLVTCSVAVALYLPRESEGEGIHA